MMGCPECRSLSDEHEPGCTWTERNPTVGGIDPSGEYYVVAHYVGEHFPHLHGKKAKVFESKEGPDWCEATFLEACTVPGAITTAEYHADYDGMRGRFLFKATCFLSEDKRAPLEMLRELRGDPKRNTWPKVDLDALGKALGVENDQPFRDNIPGLHDGGFIDAPRVLPVSLNDLTRDFERQSGETSGIDAELTDTYYCTPADAALTYALWDMSNTTKLSTPKEFDRTYPDAMRLHSWLRFHKHTIVLEADWTRCRRFKVAAYWSIAIDGAVIAGMLAFYFMNM